MAPAVPVALYECPRGRRRARCCSLFAGGRAVKYLSSQPFSSPAATKAFLANYPFKDPPKPAEVSWLECPNCGSPVRPHEVKCPTCGHAQRASDPIDSATLW